MITFMQMNHRLLHFDARRGIFQNGNPPVGTYTLDPATVNQNQGMTSNPCSIKSLAHGFHSLGWDILILIDRFGMVGVHGSLHVSSDK